VNILPENCSGKTLLQTVWQIIVGSRKAPSALDPGVMPR